MVTRDIPVSLPPRASAVCRVYVENAGTRSWFPERNPHRSGVALAVAVGTARPLRVFLRHEVHPGGRGHFVFEVTAPRHPGRLPLRLQLLTEQDDFSEATGPVLFDGFDANGRCRSSAG